MSSTPCGPPYRHRRRGSGGLELFAERLMPVVQGWDDQRFVSTLAEPTIA